MLIAASVRAVLFICHREMEIEYDIVPIGRASSNKEKKRPCKDRISMCPLILRNQYLLFGHSAGKTLET